MKFFNPDFFKLKEDNVPENGHWMFRMEYIHGELKYNIFGVIKNTPKGCWVVPFWVNPNNQSEIDKYKKFVLTGSGKRFCYPTRKEAENAFYFRKHRQILILKRQLKLAEEAFVKVGGKLPVVPYTTNFNLY